MCIRDRFTILRGHVEILLLKKFFFRLAMRALVAKIQPNKVVRWCRDGDFLWPPCVADADIIFLSCFFLSFFPLLFPRLISAVADWMSTILLHMVWPWCEFRIQVWNVVHAARWKCRTQKDSQKSPSRHRRINLPGCIFATKARIDNRKKLLNSNISSTCAHNMVNFGPLTAEIGSGVWGTPANFNGFRFLAALLHGTLVVGVSQTLRRWT